MDDQNRGTPEKRENEGFSQYNELGGEDPIVITEAQTQAKEEPKEEKLSSKIGTVLGILLIFGALIAIGFFGIRTLMLRGSGKTQAADREIVLEKGTWTKFQAYYASPECVEYKHTVNFIPTAKEHFFFVFSADLSEMALVRADKSWFEDNFTEEWVTKDPDGVTIEGYVRKTDHDVESKAGESLQTLTSELVMRFRIDKSLFIDLLAVKLSVYEILIAVIPLLAGVIYFALKRIFGDDDTDSATGKVLLVVMIIGLFVYGGFAIHVIEFF